jgi:RNA polymerase sigma-70 factor (ECF subfamily)
LPEDATISRDEFHALLLEQIPRLRRYARALTRNRDSADDLVQDCLQQALRKSELWQPGTNLRAWLFTIMHNIFVSGVRRQYAAPQVVMDPDSAQQPAIAASQDASIYLQEVERGIQALPAEQREIVLLVALEGMGYEEVGRILGIPIGTVRSRLSRARDALRRYTEGIARTPE